MSPAYRCHEGHEFDVPVAERVMVTVFEAHYGTTYISVPAGISGIDLRSSALRPNPQMSIEEIDAARIADRIIQAAPEARLLLEQFFQRRFVEEGEAGSGDAPDAGHVYVPQMSERREKITAAIRARRGQAKFRRDLRRRYGSACAITGCMVMAIVEAAHIWPYLGEENNHFENGLLLRADLHTLYDLDLIGIDEQMQAHIADELRGSEYEALQGQFLRITGRPSAAAVRERWQAFVRGRVLQAA